MSLVDLPPVPLDILVVDDTELNRQLLSAMLKKMGYHSVRVAVDGYKALEAFDQKRPDLVLMDVQMPGMDGFEATREMRQRCTEWFPILFLSANTGNEHVVQGLHAGGDDYLFKPIHYDVLKVKLKTFGERMRMTRQILEQSRSLLNYQERNKEEGEAARDFIQHFTRMDSIHDPSVQYFLRPAEIFSGDLIAYARTPDNRLHLIMADSAGHGLTSALAVVPIIQPFYAMTSKGFDLVNIIETINKQVREYLPLPRYVAVVAMSIDPVQRIIQVLNCGCPTALLLDAGSKQVLHEFASRNLPLGVLPDDQVTLHSQVVACPLLPSQLLICSDGALDLIAERSQTIDSHELLRQASQHTGALFERLCGALNSTLGTASALDDITMVLVDCDLPRESQAAMTDLVATSMQAAHGSDSNTAAQSSHWEFSITLTSAVLKNLDAVPFLLNVAQQIDGKQNDGKFFLVISELFNNALEHGLLGLNSGLKDDPDGMEQYYQQRSERLDKMATGQIVIRFTKYQENEGHFLKLHFQDSGAGFDYQAVQLDLLKNDKRHGRGIPLLAQLCRSFEYSGNGSTVTVIMDC